MKDELERIHALGEAGRIEELDALLAHEDWQVRRAAVEAVVALAFRDRDAMLGDIAERLLAALADESNAGLRNAAQEALTRLAPRCARQLIEAARDAETDVRILLAPVIGETGSAEAVPALVELAGSDDLNVATASVIGLGRSRRREALAPLLELATGENLWLTFPATEALGLLGDPAAVPALAARLPDPLMSAAARDALVAIGTPEAASAIAEHLFAPAPLRADLLEALVRIAESDWPPEVAARVRQQTIAAFRAHYNPSRFAELAELAAAGSLGGEAAVEALGWSGDPRALPVLLVDLNRPASEASASAGLAALLVDPDVASHVDAYSEHLTPTARVELARVLASAAPVEAASLVASLFADDDEEISAAAVDAALEAAARLRATRSADQARAAEVASRLVSELLATPAGARPAAVRLLCALVAAGRLDTGPLLVGIAPLFASPDPDARLAAVELAVGWATVTRSAREALLTALHDQDPAIRLRALEIARSVMAPELRAIYAAALTDEDPFVRRAAVSALAPYSDEETSRALHSALSDPVGLVAAEALSVLACREDAFGRSAVLNSSTSERAMLRCVAAERLASVPFPVARERALELAESDPDPEVRRAAVMGFVSAQADDVARVAALALADPHHAVRRAGLRLVSERDAELCALGIAGRVAPLADADPSEEVRGEALVALACCEPELALERLGAAALEPRLLPYVMRALERVAASDRPLLERYREREAPPRLSIPLDIVLSGIAP